ncbi:DUF6660 family protein [Sphingobacterium paludis]|uniref:Uncharacterized protein n=1 Tax=Sphingobacterium paludis TaxID=1476465 RepID=A0A4R7CWR4_9SPHI|nr:DUF6660 family protein [Sphingobacterium paludis]TDS12953.1 hypothetical protein B0I21_10584 [Sphingobacterium paludis]
MKLVLSILAIYFLVLSALPCRDGGDDLLRPLASAMAHQDVDAGNQNEDKHDHNQDGCSPFCSCHCCSVKIESLPLFEACIDRKPVFKLSIVQYEIDAPSIDNYPNRVWQPPKYIA